MNNLQSLNNNFDLVMVIDLTGSMGHIVRNTLSFECRSALA